MLKKSILLTIFLLVLCMGLVNAAQYGTFNSVLQQFNINQDTAAAFGYYNDGRDIAAFYTFNVTSTFNLYEVQIQIKREGSPPGDIYLTVWTIDSLGKPVTLLTQGELGYYHGDVPTTLGSFINFTVYPMIRLEAAKAYAIVLELDDYTGVTGSNYYYLARDTLTANGNRSGLGSSAATPWDFNNIADSQFLHKFYYPVLAHSPLSTVSITYPADSGAITSNDLIDTGQNVYINFTEDSINSSCSISSPSFSKLNGGYIKNGHIYTVGVGGTVTNAANAYDDDFTTYATGDTNGYIDFVFYSTVALGAPENYPGAYWSIKEGGSSWDRGFNITIPDECWNYDTSRQYLRVLWAGANTTLYMCKNSAGTYKVLKGEMIPYDTFRVYEAMLYWKKQNSFINNTALPTGATTVTVMCNDSNILGNKTDTITFSLASFGILNTSFVGNKTYEGKNYARNLGYTSYYSCASGTTAQFNVLNNGTKVYNAAATCDGNIQSISGAYTTIIEGDNNLTIKLNSTAYSHEISYNFTFDLVAPTVTLNKTFVSGFTFNNVSLVYNCTDTFWNNLSNYITLNGAEIYNQYNASGTTLYFNKEATAGVNSFVGICGDLFGNTTNSLYFTVFNKQINIIDEGTGEAFDLNNVSNLTVYYDDNRSYYSFKENSKTYINFTGSDYTKLRFEIKYNNGDIVTRYVDASIEPAENDLRICANLDNIIHYVQIITSSQQRPVTVKSIYANCVVAQDYTRFVYENNLILKAYTRNTLYYLYIYDSDDKKVYLSSMDGSLSTYYNVDVLEFNQKGYNAIITSEGLGVSKIANQTLRVYYKNIANDSVSTKFTIMQSNTSQVYFTVTETEQPNDINLLFDYSTLGLDENAQFKVTAEKTTAKGVVSSISTYFTLTGQAGSLPNGFAIVIAILLTIFGLTFTIKSISLGWFGILVQLASIGVLTLALGNDYTLWLMGINIVVMVFIIILLTNQNYEAVA